MALSFLKRFLRPDSNSVVTEPTRKAISDILGYLPQHFELYEQALIHASAAQVQDGVRIHNERLEFLGDSVLDLVVADYLFKLYPDKNEGDLTRFRSSLVNRLKLNHVASIIGLDRLIIGNFAKDIIPEDVKGNALEAFIGAIYMEAGYQRAETFIQKHILLSGKPGLPKLDTTDYKSELFMWAQRHKKQIAFETTREVGKGENRKYVINLLIDDVVLGTGEGSSKKKAQQMASKAAFKKLNLKR